MKQPDIAVIGAGPYGLSAAAYLRAQGLDVRVFGEPMSFWDGQMPAGMLLRSPWVASHISDPEGKLTLDKYRVVSGMVFSSPVPLEHFIEYGRWFQRKVVPDLDTRHVSCVRKNGTFQLTLADGETVSARRLIVAGGISAFAWRPPQFTGLPGALVSHSSKHRDLTRFQGKKVIVIGGGQSALESAALLYEAKADVEVLVRAPKVMWLRRLPLLHNCRPLERLLFAPPDVGPAFISHLVAHPGCFRLLPRRLQDKLGIRCIRPAGAAWLRSRLCKVVITTHRRILSVDRVGDRVRISLDDGSRRVADHVLLATGYKVDISRYKFLAPELLSAVERTDGYPRLDHAFETSVDGLHFVGAPAAWSFGPLMRFVVGTHFTSHALSTGITTRMGTK
jgi:pyruvate/2-oxoglutarate dehydrogenase complex dihydrolipoamide dehydrogenase (E3) component